MTFIDGDLGQPKIADVIELGVVLTMVDKVNAWMKVT